LLVERCRALTGASAETADLLPADRQQIDTGLGVEPVVLGGDQGGRDP
jgi:hypothetical protein